MNNKLNGKKRAEELLETLTKEELTELLIEAGFEVTEGEGLIINGRGEVVSEKDLL